MHTDLSAVENHTDAALAAEIATAATRFSEVRVNHPRRASLAYSDAKLAVDVLAAEQRRRNALAALDTDAAITVHATQRAAVRHLVAPATAIRTRTDPTRQCGIECTGATGTMVCTCECEGRNHGILHLHPADRPGAATGYARRLARAGGDPFHDMPVTDDEPF